MPDWGGFGVGFIGSDLSTSGQIEFHLNLNLMQLKIVSKRSNCFKG